MTVAFKPSHSYPYLSIARYFDLDYGVVLIYAEVRERDRPLHRTPWQQWAVKKVTERFEHWPNRLNHFREALDAAADHFERVRQHGMDAV